MEESNKSTLEVARLRHQAQLPKAFDSSVSLKEGGQNYCCG